jgi:SAM-dependent methyltransferase
MDKQEYWESRFVAEGKIWGDSPSQSAHDAIRLFRANNVQTVLVPGCGYGRNTKLFATAGMDVTGIEISETAYKMALQFDTRTKFCMGSVLAMSFDRTKYDAIYCFNILHLFRLADRALFLRQCFNRIKPRGFAYFTVFSDDEETFGQGPETESNTFESKPGRSVHYFTDEDLRGHFHDWQIVETGTVRDPENHGGQAHTHSLRYIFVRGK